MSSIFTLLFAPSFLFFTHYFDFQSVVVTYIFLSLLLIIYSFFKKREPKEFIVLAIYFILLIFAYFSSSFLTVKFIPVLISTSFFIMFVDATINKRELIYSFTTKFYKKELSKKEIIYLKNGDFYWLVVLFINVLIQTILVFYATDTLWALYSSIGWYIYFFIALIFQILYGKLYAFNKMSA